MNDKADITDKSQIELETETPEKAILVDEKTIVAEKEVEKQVKKQVKKQAEKQVVRSGKAGVVIPHDDVPNRFVGDTQGRA